MKAQLLIDLRAFYIPGDRRAIGGEVKWDTKYPVHA